MVVVDALHGDSVAALLDELVDGDDDLQAVFDHAALEVVAAGGEKDGEEEELEWLSNKDAFPSLETMGPAEVGAEAARPRKTGVRRRRPKAAGSPSPALPPRYRAPAKAGRRCRHCGTDETPQWRKGPEGPGTLCNACGVRYRAGRLVAEYHPLNNPTFSPELHSNRHRRVVDLARRREQESAKASPAAAATGD